MKLSKVFGINNRPALFYPNHDRAGCADSAWLAMGLSNDLLRRLFGWFLILIGIYEIVKGIRNK